MELSSVNRDESPNHTKQVEGAHDFDMDHECEKSRMEGATNELASIISSMNIGSEETPIEEYIYILLVWEEVVDA